MEPDILPRRPENVVSRKVEDYHFDNQVSERRFEESIPLRVAPPVIVRRIVSELREKGKVLIWVTGTWGGGKNYIREVFIRRINRYSNCLSGW